MDYLILVSIECKINIVKIEPTYIFQSKTAFKLLFYIKTGWIFKKYIKILTHKKILIDRITNP